MRSSTCETAIYNAQSFCDYVESVSNSTVPILITSEDIQETHAAYDKTRWSKYKTVTQTQQFHEFKPHPTDKWSINCSFTSTSDHPIPKKFKK